jgi:hypothetical protein
VRRERPSSEELEDDERKLEALRAAIEEGFASGVAEGDPFERLLL